ncbi:unnamed protein product, partial [Meganyctiphanes norvegica]
FAPVHKMVTPSPKGYMSWMQQVPEQKSSSRKNSLVSSDQYFFGDLGHNGNEDKLPLQAGLEDPIGMPSINTSTIVPISRVCKMGISSPRIYIPWTQQIDEEKSTSRKNSGASSDLYFPGDLGYNGKEDKLPLRGGLKDPIWVTPRICNHQGTNGEMCYLCRDVDNDLERPECRPDFTVQNVYGTRKPAKKKCKCGTITILTICYS